MSGVDRRGKLEDGVFTYRSGKDGRVFIAWHGRTVTTLSGRAAERFLVAVATSGDLETQLLMAKLTGNFKHGNERRPTKPGADD